MYYFDNLEIRTLILSDNTFYLVEDNISMIIENLFFFKSHEKDITNLGYH